MPADRRATFPTTKLVKTERTHEENQERAYIAASRRSDRSLEARIESARRASEIHKKRTGRALRVTEQDVVNEEMYEEEDDDLPTQYQRLNAHLQTSSLLFSRKLQNYIATQQGVRSMFLHQQFPGHSFQSYGAQFSSNASQVPVMNQSMLPPQPLNPSAQAFAQPSQPFSSQGYQQPKQGYRHTPYHIPQRPHSHQRSASISTPHAISNLGSAVSQSNPESHQANGDRRMSLPPHALESPGFSAGDGQSRPSLSRSSTSQTVHQQPVSPQHGLTSASSASTPGQGTPQVQLGNATPVSHAFTSMPFVTSSQAIDMSPLSMSLPPESQQLIGSALDPNDPRTAIFLAGSDNLPQPSMGTYTYNPNLSPKSSRIGTPANPSLGSKTGLSTPGMTQTLALEESIKLETAVDSASSATPPSAMTEGMFTSHSLFTSTDFEYSNFFDQYLGSTDGNRTIDDQVLNEPFEEDFVNWTGSG